MGSFYTQILVKHSDTLGVAKTLKAYSRHALVAKINATWIIVLDSKNEEQDVDDLDSLAYTLSHEFKTTTIGILNHDDDHLLIRVFEEIDTPRCISGSYTDCHKLLSLFESKAIALRLWFIFKIPTFGEIIRHQFIVGELGIPSWTAGLGFNYFHDECPIETPKAEFIST